MLGSPPAAFFCSGPASRSDLSLHSPLTTACLQAAILGSLFRAYPFATLPKFGRARSACQLLRSFRILRSGSGEINA